MSQQSTPPPAKVAYERRGAATPILFEIGAVILFAALVAVIANAVGVAPTGPALILIGLAVAIVPALLWLVAFYRLDHLEPEPRHFVFGVFVLGALLAAAIGQPLIRDLFQVQNWIYSGALTGILGSIFVVGFVEQFLIYAAVRYTVFNSSEYDSRVDGIVYGAAAGLGYATMINLQYVIGNGGVDLAAGVMQVSINALAQASFAAIMGYFLGRAKFDSMGPLWLPAGLVLSAVANGLVSFILNEVPFLGGFSYNPWYGLVVAGIVAGGVFLLVFALIRRLNAQTLSQAGTV